LDGVRPRMLAMAMAGLQKNRAQRRPGA
jgi:hypothetical protein